MQWINTKCFLNTMVSVMNPVNLPFVEDLTLGWIRIPQFTSYPVHQVVQCLAHIVQYIYSEMNTWMILLRIQVNDTSYYQSRKKYRKQVDYQCYSNLGVTQTSMGMAQRMELMPNRIYLPTSHLSLNIVFCFFVKLSPPPIKTGFEERMRLAVSTFI